MNIKYELVQAKGILNKLDEQDEYFLCSYTLNPYRGCSHACQYCYVQSEKYLPFKKKEEFFTKIQAKTNAPFLFQHALQKIKPGIVCIGTSCDPYQEAERKYKLTRHILEIAEKFSCPVHIITKSDLVLRDMDILSRMKNKTFCAVSFSLILTDPYLGRIFEPNTPSPKSRLRALRKLSRAGIQAGIAFMPIIPYINDEDEARSIIKQGKESGAGYVIFGEMTLRDNQKERFLGVLKKYFPKLVHRYEALYEDRVSPSFSYTKRISEELSQVCREYGLPDHMPFEGAKSPRFPRQMELW